jgi:hypothetical protein
MIMIDFLQDEAWNSLRRQMNAPLVDANAVPATVVGGLSLTELEALTTDGIDTTVDQLKIAPDQTLFFKDARVRVELVTDTSDLPVLHMAACPTIQAATSQHCRISTHTERHVEVSVVNAEGEWDMAIQQKPVCIDCLRTLNWQGMQSDLPEALQQHIEQHFDLKDFDQLYPTTLPLHTYQQLWTSERLNTYTSDWPEVAEYVKTYSRWICTACQRSFAHHRSQLWVDHLNGLKYDNTIGNLRVMCQSCRKEHALHHQ